MRYTTEIEINQPMSTVVELFDNPDNLKEWQPGLLSFEHFEGEPGQVGSRAKLHYKMGRREVEMIETVLTYDLPKEFSAIYEAKGVWNRQTNRFVEVDTNTTKWTSEAEFKGKGFMKIMMWLMPGSFKKQSLQFMEYFKEFAERQPVK